MESIIVLLHYTALLELMQYASLTTVDPLPLFKYCIDNAVVYQYLMPEQMSILNEAFAQYIRWNPFAVYAFVDTGLYHGNFCQMLEFYHQNPEYVQIIYNKLANDLLFHVAIFSVEASVVLTYSIIIGSFCVETSVPVVTYVLRCLRSRFGL